MVHLCTHHHPCQITIYYESSESCHLFYEPIFVPVTYILIYVYIIKTNIHPRYHILDALHELTPKSAGQWLT